MSRKHIYMWDYKVNLKEGKPFLHNWLTIKICEEQARDLKCFYDIGIMVYDLLKWFRLVNPMNKK